MLENIPTTVRSNLIWTEGRPILKLLIFELLCILLPLFLMSTLFGKITVLILTGTQLFFFFYFYRNPTRVQVTYDPLQVMSPADGRVISVEKLDDEQFGHQVSIFLSPLDVHVQWIPMAGKVQQIRYKKGSFSFAFMKKSELNEQNQITLQGKHGTIMVKQVAGFLTRRISCWINQGSEVWVGQKFGMIHFGSRVDVLVPHAVHITVQKGQRVRGGLTQLGTW